MGDSYLGPHVWLSSAEPASIGSRAKASRHGVGVLRRPRALAELVILGHDGPPMAPALGNLRGRDADRLAASTSIDVASEAARSSS